MIKRQELTDPESCINRALAPGLVQLPDGTWAPAPAPLDSASPVEAAEPCQHLNQLYPAGDGTRDVILHGQPVQCMDCKAVGVVSMYTDEVTWDAPPAQPEGASAPASEADAQPWSYRISIGALTGIARLFMGERCVGDLTVSWRGHLGSSEQHAHRQELERDAGMIVDRMNASPPTGTLAALVAAGEAMANELERRLESGSCILPSPRFIVAWRAAAAKAGDGGRASVPNPEYQKGFIDGRWVALSALAERIRAMPYPTPNLNWDEDTIRIHRSVFEMTRDAASRLVAPEGNARRDA